MKSRTWLILVLMLVFSVAQVKGQEPTPQHLRSVVQLVEENGEFFLTSELVHTKDLRGLPSGEFNVYQTHKISLEPMRIFFVQESLNSFMVFIDAGSYFLPQPDFANLPPWEGYIIGVGLQKQILYSGEINSRNFTDVALQIYSAQIPGGTDIYPNDPDVEFVPKIELEPTTIHRTRDTVLTAPYYCVTNQLEAPSDCYFRPVTFQESDTNMVIGWGELFYLSTTNEEGEGVMIPIPTDLDESCLYQGPLYGGTVHYFSRDGETPFSAHTCESDNDN